MGGLRRKNLSHRLGALALAAFWALGLLAEPFRALAPHLEEVALREGTPVSQAEIRAPGHDHGICQHHPEGCPKDCFCPKLDPRQAAADAEAPAPTGAVAEPALDHCSEARGGDLLPAHGPVFACAAFVFVPMDLEPVERLHPVPPPHPSDPFLEPPFKVPVA